MMARKVFQLINGGPSQGVAEAIATAKATLRRHDLRGVALITVTADGVGTLYGGADDGFYHHLISGTEILKKRIIDDKNQ